MSWTFPSSLRFTLILSIALIAPGCSGGDDGGSTPPTPAPRNVWTWVSGSNVIQQVGVYGTKGVADANNVPGARDGAVSWTDSSNNLWLFGGNGYDSVGSATLNDLWKFNPATGQWTWVSGNNMGGEAGRYGTKGVAGANNVPGGRFGAVSWIDNTGMLWLFGGQGFASTGTGELNDLWKFNPTTNEWTWVSGSNGANQAGTYGTKGTSSSANVPGARSSSVGWIDSTNNLWLFGGTGIDRLSVGGRLNDFWRFNPGNNEWAWISGSDTIDGAADYGQKGVAANTNVPGARVSSTAWIDSSDTLWLFGGDGVDSIGTPVAFNDLWKFIPTTGQWTWVSGSNVVNQAGDYGTKGVAAASNVPGARGGANSWTDAADALWLFGGNGLGGSHNDLWKFNISTGQWVWVSGSNTVDQAAIYGTKGVPATANIPGSKTRSVSWVDSGNTLWLFGGVGRDSTGVDGYLNDLWRYVP